MFVLLVSGSVVAGQKQTQETVPASSVQKIDATSSKGAGVLTGNPTKEIRGEGVHTGIKRLQSALEEASRKIKQAIIECETKNKGANYSRKALDGMEISRQLEKNAHWLRECIEEKKDARKLLIGLKKILAVNSITR
jgi:hypothetical protein